MHVEVSVMTIIELGPDIEPPMDKPRITLNARRDGTFEFYGCSESLDIQVDPRLFQSRAEARSAAISWAAAHCYGEIYLVERDVSAL